MKSKAQAMVLASMVGDSLAMVAHWNIVALLQQIP
jgi:hypothetical protein